MKQTFSQGGWGVLEYLAYPLLMLVATPFLFSQLGAAQYGVWMLLNAVTGLGGVANVGMGAATVKVVSAHRAKGDMSLAASSVRTCLLVCLFGVVSLCGVIALVTVLLPESVFERMGSPEMVTGVLLIACVFIGLEQVDSVFANALKGLERFDVAARIEIVARFITIVVVCAVAWVTPELLTVLLALGFVTVLRTTLKIKAVATLLNTAWLGPYWHPELAKEAFNFGRWSWLQSLGALAFGTADRLIVGSLLGAESLARYSICIQLAQQIHAIPSAGIAVTFPVVSRRREAGLGSLREVAVPAIAMNVVMAVALAGPIVLFAEPILTHWINADFAAQASSTLLWLAAAYFLLALNVAPHYLLLGCSEAKSVSLTNIAGGLVALAVSLVLIPTGGVIGAAQARLSYALSICANYILLGKLWRRL